MTGATERDRPDVSIVSSGHDVADARLHREVAALLERGLSVEVLGLGRREDAPEGVDVRTWARPGLVGRAVLAVRQPYLARGRVLFTLDPDSGLSAALASRPLRRRLVVDVHEDYTRLLQDRDWARRLGSVPRVAAQGLVATALRLFARADLVVVADEHVPPARARARLVVRNLPDLAMLPEPGPRAELPRALYVGDLRASRGLFAMVEAARLAPEWEFDLVGPVAAGDEARLRSMLTADPSLAARVRLHGRRPPAQAWQVGVGAWTGLLLLADTPAFRDALPSKLYEYLACGLPVVTTELPRPAGLVRRHDAGAVVPLGDDAAVGAATAEVLRAWSADPTSLEDMRRRLAEAAVTSRAGATPYRQLADAVAELARPGDAREHPSPAP